MGAFLSSDQDHLNLIAVDPIKYSHVINQQLEIRKLRRSAQTEAIAGLNGRIVFAEIGNQRLTKSRPLSGAQFLKLSDGVW